MTEVAFQEKMGTQELTEVVMLALEVLDSGHLIAADNKVNWADVADIWGIIQKLGPAFIDIHKVPAEISDLSLDELDTLIDTIDIGYQIGTEKSKEVLMKVLKIIRNVYEVFLLIRG